MVIRNVLEWPPEAKLSTQERANFMAAPQAKNDLIFCFSPQNATYLTQDYVSLAFENVLRYIFCLCMRNEKTFPTVRLSYW